MNYYIITLQDKQTIKVKTQKLMGDIVRFFLGDFTECYTSKGHYKLKSIYNGVIDCKIVNPNLSVNPAEFITV